MPATIAMRIQPTVDFTIQSGNSSRDSIVDVDGGGGKAGGPQKHRPGVADAQASATSRRNRRTARSRRSRAGSRPARGCASRATPSAPRPRSPPAAARSRPGRIAGRRIRRRVRNDSGCVATARTNWKRNEAQSCWSFQISTGENTATAISAAHHGYGLRSQRPRQSGTSMNATTAGSSMMAVNFDSSASPANSPAASHQRPSPLSLSRTSDHSIATANGISAVSGATLAIKQPVIERGLRHQQRKDDGAEIMRDAADDVGEQQLRDQHRHNAGKAHAERRCRRRSRCRSG